MRQHPVKRESYMKAMSKMQVEYIQEHKIRGQGCDPVAKAMAECGVEEGYGVACWPVVILSLTGASRGGSGRLPASQRQ